MGFGVDANLPDTNTIAAVNRTIIGGGPVAGLQVKGGPRVLKQRGPLVRKIEDADSSDTAPGGGDPPDEIERSMKNTDWALIAGKISAAMQLPRLADFIETETEVLRDLGETAWRTSAPRTKQFSEERARILISENPARLIRRDQIVKVEGSFQEWIIKR